MTATPRLDHLLADLDAESAELDALVAPLDPQGWATPTPAEGWTVAHQISHLAWTDRLALLSAADPAAFLESVKPLATDVDGPVQAGAAEGAGEPPAQLLARWRAGRAALLDALRTVSPQTRLTWFATTMKPASMATSRLMETWAHGLDVAEALGAEPSPTPRLRHVAHLGVRTRDHSFRTHGLTPPAAEFRVALTGPDGEPWAWGPPDAAQSVSGPALDFCHLVTQRRDRADLALVAEGPDADRWLDIAQAFAGPPGKGRPPS